MRGIERYVQNQSQYDDHDLRQLALEWEKLRPRLIQQVDHDEQGVFVEDLFTKERFHMPYCETMPHLTPWAGAFCMLEEFEGGYYLNGVTFTVGPDQVMQAYELLKQSIVETDQSFDQVAMELYPEILQALLTKRDLLQHSVEKSIIRNSITRFKRWGMWLSPLMKMAIFKSMNGMEKAGKGV